MERRQHLFMPAKHVANGWRPSESLMDLHRGATGIGEHSVHALLFQRLYKDVTALAGLIAVSVLPLLCTCSPGQPATPGT